MLRNPTDWTDMTDPSDQKNRTLNENNGDDPWRSTIILSLKSR